MDPKYGYGYIYVGNHMTHPHMGLDEPSKLVRSQGIMGIFHGGN